MAPRTEASSRRPSDREGLSPSPGVSSSGIVTLADLLTSDDDDIEFEPSSERSDITDGAEDEEDEEDVEEYVGIIGICLPPAPCGG
jgi:hypothetical protein